MIIETRKISELIPANYNPRQISPAALAGLKASIARYGLVQPIIINRQTGNIVGGHQRLVALIELLMAGEVEDLTQVIVVDLNLAEEKTLNITLNNPAIQGTFTPGLLPLLDEIKATLGAPFMQQLQMDTLYELIPIAPGIDAYEKGKEALGGLAARFIAPPFTVLDCRQGYWQERKRLWVAIGIDSVQGREMIEPGMDMSDYVQRGSGNISIFDPVLTEVLYKWFCPPGGKVLDPFAGGSVRGIVAGIMGLEYHGVDLSQQQVAANQAQWDAIAANIIKTQGAEE